MSFSRRALLRLSGAAALGSRLHPPTELAGEDLPLPAPLAELKPMTAGIPPIGLEEHKARLLAAQRLMTDAGLDAIAVGPGTGLTYFTGAEWGLSERFLGLVLTREGDPAWITPAFEKTRALEQIRMGSDVRAWEEHESPYDLVASILRDRKVAGGRMGIEETMPFVFADGIAKAAPALRLESATPVTAGCRMIKDSHEIALMRRAGQITLSAHRAVFASLKEGMTQSQVSALSAQAHRRLGIPGGSLVLFGANAAFPHGTKQPRPLKAGDVVLIDGGGSFHGYASDITRTGVFGAPPTPRQREVWDLVRKAQEAAVRAGRPGVECQALDAAARKVITDGGFGPAYASFTHRLGHGIGMDGHEWTYLVRGNSTKLRPGMCFSNEPGVYLPGEMGIRHEDVMTVTEDAVENLTKWSGSPEDPAVI
ncbi:MAG TPA: Xaa-Pro peptidase family protein [Vicinamibacteria bacterium]|jgi:Xaa-Pro dipeptidase|nr:Xaa-Pro peptidase family protein [Vicinamibacteria bacterium]